MLNMDIVEPLESLIVVGDRVLIKPKEGSDQTKSGLFLPPSVKESEQVHSGYIIKVGPGYAVGSPDEDDVWKRNQPEPKYIPLQVSEGDLAVYLPKQGIEIQFNNEKYVILPQSAILMVVRDNEIFE